MNLENILLGLKTINAAILTTLSTFILTRGLALGAELVILVVGWVFGAISIIHVEHAKKNIMSEFAS